MAAKINCSICGKLTDPTLENCPHCGTPIEVGGTRAPVTPHVPPAAEKKGESCPSCGAAVQDGDIVCVRCGVNLLTGHQVAGQKHEEVAAPPRSKAPLAIGALVVVVLLLVAVLGFVLLRDPVQRARQTAREGRVLDAITLLQTHTDRVEDDADAFALLGRLYWQTQKYADSSSAFDTASRLDPGDEDLAFMAVLAAGKIPGDTGANRQLSALKRMAEHHPDNVRARKMLALAEGAAGQLDASEATLSALSGMSSDTGEVQTYQGVVDALGGDLAGARTALAGGSTDAARIARGYLASLEGETAEATAILDGAVAAGGEHPVAETRLGLLYMAQGNIDKALPLLRPREGQIAADSARFFYGLCLQTAGLGDEAMVEYERLLASGGEFAEDAAVQMAILYLERGRLEDAAESVRKARKYGTSARLYTVEGQIAALQGDLETAQRFYRDAIQEDPNYPAAHLEHGIAYVRRGALPEGVRELERYLELAPADPVDGGVNEVELLVKQLQQTLARGGS